MSERPKIKQEVVERIRADVEFDMNFADNKENTEATSAILAMLDWYEAGK